MIIKLRFLGKLLFATGLIGVLFIFLVDYWVIASTKDQIESLSDVQDADCILVLGAGV